jgi:hypothetical protein
MLVKDVGWHNFEPVSLLFLVSWLFYCVLLRVYLGYHHQKVILKLDSNLSGCQFHTLVFLVKAEFVVTRLLA